MKRKSLFIILALLLLANLHAAEQPKKKKKRLGRAVLEAISVHGAGTIAYWLDQKTMKGDWQYALTWKDQSKRFFSLEAHRFDTNSFALNWGHTIAGVGIHHCARANGLNLLESTIFDLGGSLFWEYIGEFREIIAINDNIFNTFGGMALGEPLFQLHRYFFRKPPSRLNRMLAFACSPITGVDRWLTRKKNRDRSSEYPLPYHRFSFTLGPRMKENKTAHGGTPAPGFLLELATRLVHVPGYGEPGTGAGVWNHLAVTELNGHAELTGDATLLRGAGIFARTGWWSYYARKLKDTGQGPPEGSMFLFSLGSVFQMREFNREYAAVPVGIEKYRDPGQGKERDRWALAAPLDLETELSVNQKHWSGCLRLKGFLGFGLIHAWAYPAYYDKYGYFGIKTILRRQGYYFAWCYSLGASVRLGLGPLRWKGEVTYIRFSSIQGLDRFQDRVFRDFRLQDSRTLWRTELFYHFPTSPVQYGIAIDITQRTGKALDITETSTQTRAAVLVRWVF